MFTAMISRHHLLIALPALALGLGVGWAAFELGRGRVADAPRTVTSAPTAEQASGEAVGPQSEAPPSPAVGADASGGSDQGADLPAAGSIDQPEPLQAQVSQGQAESPEAVATRPAAEPDRQVGALSTPGEPESGTTETTPPAAVPQAEPAITGEVVESPSSEDQAVASAPSVGGVGEESASPDQVAARAAATGGPADSDPAADAPPQAPLAAQRSEPDQPAAQPDADETVALAVPAPAEEEADPAPGSSAAPSPADPQAVPEEPGVDETVLSDEAQPRPDDPRAAPARAAETMKRALATLFGGGIDEAVPPARGEADVAAVPESAPAAAAPDQGSAPGDLEPGAAPTFDIVRIAPGGRTVIAGRAAPGAEVEIRSAERMIDRVRADRRGEWVAVPPEPLAAGVQELSLAARVEDQLAVESAEVLVIAVPDPPPPDIALRALDAPPPPQPAQVAAAESGDEAFAVALPREGAGKGRILQAPGRISSDGALALVMLDYDDAGRIRLSGEASAGAALRIYVDNEPAGATVVGPGGRWDAVLERTLTPGDYTLRLDQLGASGKPDARLETPFTRVSQPPVAGDVQVDYVIVQPGNSLWRIARRVLGEGIRYVHIYEANQAHIRDPDLIYPGQVFEVPSTIGAAG
jgi:nucleoid-associated protein YgaU